MEFDVHIWNHHEKCIQISTKMPSIGSIICEIDVEIEEKHGKTNVNIKPALIK